MLAASLAQPAMAAEQVAAVAEGDGRLATRTQLTSEKISHKLFSLAPFLPIFSLHPAWEER